MRRHIYKLAVVWALVSVLWGGVWAAEAGEDGVTQGEADTKGTEVKVSVSARDSTLSEVLDSLSKQSKQKIIVESTVKGTLGSLSLSDVTLESALTAVCKAAKLEWRKVYLNENSSLLEQPDKFAATVRLLSGLSFPDLVVADSSTGKTVVHVTDDKLIDKARDALASPRSLTAVYLVTNDVAAAAKAVGTKEDGAESTSPAVDKYAQIAKDQIDIFMKMTPEERERAILESINLMDQVGPSYVSAVMQTLLSTDQENLRRIVARQTEMLFHMSDEQRRAILKLNIQSMSMLTPEQQRILQEDSMAVMKEIQSE